MTARYPMRRSFAIALLAFALLAGVPGMVAAAPQLFLKLTQGPSNPILGDSTVDRHAGEIEVTAYGWEEKNLTSGGSGGGGGAGKVDFSDLTIAKKLDRASPQLYALCANGLHLTSATLTVETGGNKSNKLLTIDLTDLRVTSVQPSGTLLDVPTEIITLGFNKIRWTYYVYDSKGGLLTTIVKSWDLVANSSVALASPAPSAPAAPATAAIPSTPAIPFTYDRVVAFLR